MNPDNATLLLVDDDRDLTQLMHQYLSQAGFDVLSCNRPRELNMYLEQHAVDLMVLDLMMPGEDGLSILRRLQQRDFPIIMLSARGQEMDRIVGLEVGADDYLAKPFNPRELLARIRAVLRRPGGRPHNDQARYFFGPFVLDRTSRCLLRDGETVNLTDAEFELLDLFIRHPNQLLNRDLLVEQLHGYERTPFDRSVDIRVTRLRRKIEPDPGNPIYVRTVWGKGYQFTPGGND